MIADDTFEINPEATIGMLIIINGGKDKRSGKNYY